MIREEEKREGLTFVGGREWSGRKGARRDEGEGKEDGGIKEQGRRMEGEIREEEVVHLPQKDLCAWKKIQITN